MNIWTHLIGSAGFVAAGIGLRQYTLRSHIVMSSGDSFALGVFLAAAAICFGLSAIFHTLRSHSYNVHHLWGKMDILGICILALGGGCSVTYYAFYCNTIVRRVYWCLNAGAALAAAYTLFDTGGGGSKMRALRGGVFSLLAVAAMLPIVHCLGLLGWARACEQIGVQWYLAEGLSLLIGVGLFVGRLPERLSPGRFDIWGHSHQLFHMCAVAGTASHVVALKVGLEYRQSHPGC
ncbi:Hly-III related protein [Myriangium duriaei CBS 260.36]|uniref:Hly-III related protein n=1 Tax=Myriangium duriaei CBS 260.36 TaxID=1168546 RepID=A0A9P4IYE0_9PEZI|nr:Hly-III related protein [Myriangium duriaei CBS 260.36]